MLRPRTVAIGALAVLLIAAPFVPRGDDEDGALSPAGKGPQQLGSAATAGPSRITPEAQAAIDQVVAETRSVPRISARAAARGTVAPQLVPDLVQCADFDGQRYCLGAGWTDDTEAEVQSRMATASRVSALRRTTAGATTNTGDLDAAALLARQARMTPAERATAVRTELEDAARSVAKVWLLRHEIQGVPLPRNFLAEHPEAAAPAGTSARTAAKAKKRIDYPQKSAVLSTSRVAEQTMTYWCGPTTMQMIAWGWKNNKHSQQYWANKLGTTSGGTAITEMVRVVNENTGWDSKDRAGTYITLDIGDYTYGDWALLMMRHIEDYRAPVVLHPALLKRFYPYLDDDASGHFQVGRGYDKRGKKPLHIGYFEPWNQQRFDPSEPYINRVQWRNAYKSYRANQAHFQHNIGV